MRIWLEEVVVAFMVGGLGKNGLTSSHLKILTNFDNCDCGLCNIDILLSM